MFLVLLDLIYGKYKTVSIVGLAKNTGKTVALNHISGGCRQGYGFRALFLLAGMGRP